MKYPHISSSSQRGFSLLELMISMVLVAIIGLTLMAFERIIFFQTETVNMKMYVENKYQLRIAQMLQDIEESSASYLVNYTVNDSKFPTGSASLLILPSARDQNGNFQTENHMPKWVKLIIYYPYAPVTGEIRVKRHEEYGTFSFPLSPVKSVDTTNHIITLDNGTKFNVSSAEDIMKNLNRFDISKTQPLKVQVNGWYTDMDGNQHDLILGSSSVYSKN